MKKRIIAFGKSGQLGSALASLAHTWSDTFNLEIYGRPEGDLTDREQIKKLIAERSPALIINASAYTAVDNAEDDEQNAFELNAVALYNLAKECNERNIPLIHISTDYVFDGTQVHPYQPGDQIAPINAYGRTKLAGEWACRAVHPEGTYVIRTSWVFSEWGNNFVKTMLKLATERDTLDIVHDQVGSPTYATDLAEATLLMAKKIIGNSASPSGVYHYANSGECSWFEFAQEILKNETVSLSKTTSDRFSRPAKRPQFSKLDSTKLQDTFGLKIRTWQDALQACLSRLSITT